MNEISTALQIYLTAFKEFKRGEISKEEMMKEETRYKEIVKMYTWNTG